MHGTYLGVEAAGTTPYCTWQKPAEPHACLINIDTSLLRIVGAPSLPPLAGCPRWLQPALFMEGFDYTGTVGSLTYFCAILLFIYFFLFIQNDAILQ